ncbi:hypothetical protein, partial [Streptomyces sp. NPDC057909]|uniref:hypothetical protein n=1 Tax=Streptomyces sp. NPDC057909 TaxID=3346277 RepID=UPI0036EAF1A0
MTDTTITPVEAPKATPDTTPAPAPEQKPTPTTAEVEHTPGGWPVVPLAVTGTNATTSLLAAAALIGGPAALAVAATGALVLGTAAATRKHRDNKKPGKTTGRTSRSAAGAGSVGRTTRHGGVGRVPTQARSGNAGTRKTTGRGRGKPGRSTVGSWPGTGKAGGLISRPRNIRKTPTAHATAGAPGKSRGRAGQVKSLRETARQMAPSRAARRAETAGSRRAVADTCRGAKAAARSASLARKGPVGRSVSKAAGRVGAAKGAAIDRNRKARDQRTAGKVAAQRDDVRKAPARKKARKALWRSAARFQGRRLFAALLAGALALVGMFTTPLGRKLSWAWLQYPGRRLYARMTRTAEEQRTDRDDAIGAALEHDEAAADNEASDNA